jgi:hypothetical protein
MRTLIPLITLVVVLRVSSAEAQTWSDEQRDVWKVITAQWKALQSKDPKWLEFLHPKFVGWSSDAPAPDTPEAVGEWSRFHYETTTVLVQKLSPIAIVIHGDTAVAHYYFSEGRDHKDSGRKVAHGRFTDVLVRENGKWLFLAWHGGDKPETEE